MTKWEYRTITLPAFQLEAFGSSKLRIDLLEDILKDYGNEGWELASHSFLPVIVPNEMVLIFKRPKE
jgi:Domain of unknown function (DUF4177)